MCEGEGSRQQQRQGRVGNYLALGVGNCLAPPLGNCLALEGLRLGNYLAFDNYDINETCRDLETWTLSREYHTSSYCGLPGLTRQDL
jgi:hypothetical protein